MLFGIYKYLIDFAGCGATVPLTGFGNLLSKGAISEAKERVRSAIKNSGYHFPNQKVVINLAPADIRKEGTLYDLPIAMGILARDGIVKEEEQQVQTIESYNNLCEQKVQENWQKSNIKN